MRTSLILSRHGQTVWHRENRYAGGTSDIDLTDVGRLQARSLAAWAVQNRPDAIYCSPVRRALETAAPSLTALGVRARIVDDLRELDFGVAEGRTMAELDSEIPDAAAGFRRDPVRNPLPGSEPPELAAERGAAALRKIAAEVPGGEVLVVAHNTLIRVTLCRLLGLPVGRYREILPRLDNGALTTISLPASGGGPAALLSLNVPLEDSSGSVEMNALT